MRNKKFVEMAKLFKVELKNVNRFHIDQIERCRELLLEAIQTAAKCDKGKPIFYTSLKRKTRSGRTLAYSVHYFDDVAGEMRCLNYMAAILLSLRLDEKERYIIARTQDYAHGKSIIWALSRWVVFGKRRRLDYITPKEL